MEDNSILIFSELMGSESVFLTANADTVYFLSIVDLTSGPMVVETPPQALGVIDDMWWGWIIDFGLSGRIAARAAVSCSFHPATTARCRTAATTWGTRAHRGRSCSGGRSWQTNDPSPTVATIKSTTRIYPYAKGGSGTSVATLLEGRQGAPHPPAADPETVFVEGSGKSFNTVPPSDFGFFELLNEVVQAEPAGSTNAELMGQLAAIGIVKGEPFAPAERMRRTSRTPPPSGTRPRGRCTSTHAQRKSSAYYDGSGWFNPLWVGGYDVRDAAAAGHEGGHRAVPRDRRPEATLEDGVPLRGTPGSRPRCACG